MKIYNPTHAFIRIEAGEHVLLVDPWVSPRIFDGGWAHFPPLEETDRWLRGVTHLYLSCAEPDHFDLETINKIARNVTIFLPNVANDRMVSDLQEMKFENIRVLTTGVREKINERLSIEITQPMDQTAAESMALKQGASKWVVGHTSLIAFCEERKFVFLGDNEPYAIRAMGASYERMQGCDLLAFPFNGAGSDDPTCYHGLSPEEAAAQAERRERQRALLFDRFFSLVRPKNLMPYASDFAAAGPIAERFAKMVDGWWADRDTATKRYADTHSVPTHTFREGDYAEVIGGKVGFCLRNRVISSLSTVCRTLVTEESDGLDSYQDLGEKVDQLPAMIKDSAQHMFESMDAFGLKSEWVLELDLMDGNRHFVDLQGKQILNDKPSGRKNLRCQLDPIYLVAILIGRSHWSMARKSFLLQWKRDPNEYDEGLYGALDFFHLPDQDWQL